MHLHPQVNKNDLKLVPFFDFAKNIKHVSDEKFIEVHVCQNLSK